MNSVFLLWFVHDRDTAEEDTLVIGVYKTEADAKSAIDRLATKPGFVDEPGGLEISEYELNKDHWSDGFVSVSGLPAWLKISDH